jgi:hypothetical protein
MFKNKKIILSSFCLFLLSSGCSQYTKSNDADNKADMPQKQLNRSVKTDVAKIIFVGQKKSCKCTQTRIAASLKALKSVLKNYPEIKIKQIQLDVEEEQADKLDDIQSLMVAPGIYFFDKKQHLKKMVQGEVKAQQILKIIEQ